MLLDENVYILARRKCCYFNGDEENYFFLVETDFESNILVKMSVYAVTVKIQKNKGS